MVATDSLAVHGKYRAKKNEPIVPDLSTSKIPAWESLEDGSDIPYAYGRSGNTTTELCEKKCAALEGGGVARLCSSGMAAITVLLHTLKKGDHVIFGDNLYGGTEWVAKDFGEKFLDVSFVDTTDINAIEKEIKENTVWVFVESPTNPLLKIVDLVKLNELCERKNIGFVLDSTFATPFLLKGFEVGAHAVIHSLSKYGNGQNDAIGGVIITEDEVLLEKIQLYRRRLGVTLDPRVSHSISQGLQTLGIRLERAQKSAQEIAQFLENHPKIERIYYPGLESHPQHKLAKEQMKGSGGLIAFDIKADHKAFAKAVNRSANEDSVIYLSESLGGVQSLLAHPASMSHRHLSSKQRAELGIYDTTFRLSVGIEEVQDIIASLKKGLDA